MQSEDIKLIYTSSRNKVVVFYDGKCHILLGELLMYLHFHQSLNSAKKIGNGKNLNIEEALKY